MITLAAIPDAVLGSEIPEKRRRRSGLRVSILAAAKRSPQTATRSCPPYKPPQVGGRTQPAAAARRPHTGWLRRGEGGERLQEPQRRWDPAAAG